MVRTRPVVERSKAPPDRVLTAVGGASILGQVVTLAGPVLVEQALVYLVGLSDTVLTGRYLSVEHLAAVTTASYLAWFVSSVLMVVSAGATALVARRIGAGDRAEARAIAGRALILGGLVGCGIAVIGWIGSDAFVRSLNLRGLAAEQAALYIRTVLVAGPLLAVRAVGVAALRGAGDTRAGMWTMAAVNAVNIALSWGLVVGLGPLPRLGLFGVALGTAIGEGVGGLLVLGLLIRGRSGLSVRWADFRPDPAGVRRIFRISLPAAAESVTNAVCQLWFLGLINRLGAEATAAHGVAIRCEALAFLTLMAFAVAGGTLAGQYLGAGRPDLARQAARTAWACALLGAIGLGAATFLVAPGMVALFVPRAGAGVIEQGSTVLRLVAFALPALATIQVCSGVLRGVGETRWPWFVVMAGYLAVRMPLTYLLTTPEIAGGLGWGLLGAWIAMFADLHARAGLLTWIFLRGDWTRKRI